MRAPLVLALAVLGLTHAMDVLPQWSQTVLVEELSTWTGRALIFDPSRKRAYAQTVDAGANGYLTAIDQTGVLWNVTDGTNDAGDFDRSELGYDELTGVVCYVITPSSGPGQVRGVDGATGLVLWQWSNWTNFWNSETDIPRPLSTTTPSGQRVFVVGQNAVHLLDAMTGLEVSSRVPLQIEYGYVRVPDSPLLIVGSWPLAAVNLSDMSVAWTSRVNTSSGAPFYAYLQLTPDSKTFFALTQQAQSSNLHFRIAAVDVQTPMAR